MKKIITAILLCLTFVTNSSLIYANQQPITTLDEISETSSSSVTSNTSTVIKPETQVEPAFPKVVKGRFTTINRSGFSTPVKQALVELYYEKPDSTYRFRNNTYTNDKGEFEIKHNLPSEVKSAYIRLTLDNQFIRIENTSKVAYTYKTATLDPSQSEININDHIENSEELKKAIWTFDDITQARDKLKNLKLSSQKVTVVWSSKTTGQDVWLGRENKINLYANAPTSNSTILFLFAQKHMYDQYKRVLPVDSTCSKGVSYDLSTSPQCAWTQGWAYFISMWINNSSIFTYADGKKWDGEVTSNIEQIGNKVEGRVAGVLWDLYDKANDGLDTVNYPIEQIFQTMYESRIYSIDHYWKKWQKIGFDVNAEKALRQNKVLFDTFPILEAGVTQILNGESQKVFEMIGYDGYPTITSDYFHEKTDVKLEIFNDPELTSRAAIDDDSRGSGYAIINNHRFYKGKKYYLKVTNFDVGKPIYAKISYTAVTDVNMNNLILDSDTPGFLNGENEKVFLLVGTGKRTIIETSRFGDKYDTVMILMTNGGNGIIAVNDNTTEDNYSRITTKLTEGLLYYVRVTNHYEGKPVCAKVTVKELD
jgi:hypothetical protein